MPALVVFSFRLMLLVCLVWQSQAYIARVPNSLRFTSVKCGGAVPLISSPLKIRQVNDLDMPAVASFIATHEYGPRMPNGQRKEATRLTLNCLRDTYGSRIGRWLYPSALFVAEKDDHAVGCIGLAYKYFNPSRKEFAPVILPNVSLNAYIQHKLNTEDTAFDENISIVLTHLVVSREKNNHGIAPALVKHCEDLVKDWGFKYAHIMTHSDDKAGDAMYRTLGYKKHFRGKTTRAVSSPVGLKQELCGYYCYRKAVDEEPEQRTTLQCIFDYITNILM